MHILFLTDNFPPEVNAPATRTYEHCIEWVNKGHTVTVITCAPNFPQGKVYKGYKNSLYSHEYINKIKVIRVWSYMAPNSGFIKRIFDFLSFSLMSFFVGIFQKHDIIVATSPQFFTSWSGWAISKIKRKPWIFEVRDLFPESIKTVNLIRQGFAINLLERIELALYKDCDKVVVVTNAFKNNLIKRGIKENKIEVITNGSNIRLFHPRDPNKNLLSKLELNNKFIIGYIGTHGMAHKIDFILNSIKQITDSSLHFLFIGDGSEKQKLVKQAKKLDLINVTFLDSVPKDQVPEYLSIIDISLVPLKKSDNFKTVIPSKIFESAAMMKPILLGVEGQAQEIIEEHNAGLCFEPENHEDLILKLEKIQQKSVYHDLQRGCNILAQTYDREILAEKMLSILEKVSK
jgi:glycosyltransferase involved in cell wall biosynthesis